MLPGKRLILLVDDTAGATRLAHEWPNVIAMETNGQLVMSGSTASPVRLESIRLFEAASLEKSDSPRRPARPFTAMGGLKRRPWSGR